jgi:hypothetical protein
MRTILLGDIVGAARALLALPKEGRSGCLDLMITQSHAAHLFQKRLKKPHPIWGNGSLMARANTEQQVDEPFVSNIEYLRTLHFIIGALIVRTELRAIK